MIALEVAVNGRRLCRAGVGKSGVLTAFVNWVGGSLRSPRHGGRTKSGESRISVGGLYGSKWGVSVHPRWVNRLVHAGDEITIRVLEARRVDPPKWKQVTTAAETRKQQRAYYLELKKKFEPRKAKAGRTGKSHGAGV